MLKTPEICGIIIPIIKGVFDIMNGNAISSLAMVYALWQTSNHDLLDLIRPFVVYAVGNTTNKGDEISAERIAHFMETEFGYKFFQVEVVKRILNREIANKQIEKRNNRFYLIGSYQQQVDDFNLKRTSCKSHSDRVTHDLAEYLNNQTVKGRNNYSQKDAEALLLSFFERQGKSVVLSVEDFQSILYKNNEIDYHIGHFILKAKEDNSILMDYLVELATGYFVTTAFYLQAENQNVTTASFKNITFFLDTRLLLGLLGYKAKEENDSIQETITCLAKHGAKIACFEYNANEVQNILSAYKYSAVKNSTPSAYTLEHFDELRVASSVIDYEQRRFRERLISIGLEIKSFSDVLSDIAQNDYRGTMDETLLRDNILSIRPSYNLYNDDDIRAIESVSRIRRGEKLPDIEKCKAVFVTANSVLVAATKKYLTEEQIDVGFPLVITAGDLSVIAWLKQFGQNSQLPKMRLLENVLAAITPDQELLRYYYELLDTMKDNGLIKPDEVYLLQIDLFARKELMRRTQGDKDRITESVINDIRETLRKESYEQGVYDAQIEASNKFNVMREALRKESYEQGVYDAQKAAALEAKEKEQQLLREKQFQRNAVCKRAEDEVKEDYQRKLTKSLIWYRIICCIMAATFVGSSIVNACIQPNTFAIIITAIGGIFSLGLGLFPFFKKDTFVTKWLKKRNYSHMLLAIDEKKKEYLEIIDGDSVKT